VGIRPPHGTRVTTASGPSIRLEPGQGPVGPVAGGGVATPEAELAAGGRHHLLRGEAHQDEPAGRVVLVLVRLAPVR